MGSQKNDQETGDLMQEKNLRKILSRKRSRNLKAIRDEEDTSLH